MGNHSTASSRSSEKCLICLESIENHLKRLDNCGHIFHRECIDQWFRVNDKCSCPTCGHIYQRKKGSQPSNGQMKWRYKSFNLPGFENEIYSNEKEKTIEILYDFPDGIQRSDHPRPGKKYSGTRRKAYLPNTNEGKEILQLLREAFDDQQIFTISRSVTTGEDNVITWNDIHHKSNINGGPTNYGYPDPTYLSRVRHELAAKGYQTRTSSS